jgi:hypothetical protein
MFVIAATALAFVRSMRIAVTRHAQVFRQQRQRIVVLIFDDSLWQGCGEDKRHSIPTSTGSRRASVTNNLHAAATRRSSRASRVSIGASTPVGQFVLGVVIVVVVSL